MRKHGLEYAKSRGVGRKSWFKQSRYLNHDFMKCMVKFATKDHTHTLEPAFKTMTGTPQQLPCMVGVPSTITEPCCHPPSVSKPLVNQFSEKKIRKSVVRYCICVIGYYLLFLCFYLLFCATTIAIGLIKKHVSQWNNNKSKVELSYEESNGRIWFY